MKFKTNTPQIAQFSYLNIIFPPAKIKIQDMKIKPLNLPDEISLFYREFNGASLLNSSIDIYGFLPDKYYLDRTDWRNILPFDIMEDNNIKEGKFLADKLIFGSYGYDRSGITIDLQDGSIEIKSHYIDMRKSIKWPSFSVWFESEMARLNELFDENGYLLTDIKNTLPIV